MKATGMVRFVDQLGRIVLPKEMRRTLAINDGDPVEFYADEDCIVVKKYDVAGDMAQVLDKLEQTIQMKSPLLAPVQVVALQKKAQEMRDILTAGDNEGGQIK